jgi:hypothetical protein
MGLFQKKEKRSGDAALSLFGAPANPIDGIRSIQADIEAEQRQRLLGTRAGLYLEIEHLHRQTYQHLDLELRAVLELADRGSHLSAETLVRNCTFLPFYRKDDGLPEDTSGFAWLLAYGVIGQYLLICANDFDEPRQDFFEQGPRRLVGWTEERGVIDTAWSRLLAGDDRAYLSLGKLILTGTEGREDLRDIVAAHTAMHSAYLATHR